MVVGLLRVWMRCPEVHMDDDIIYKMVLITSIHVIYFNQWAWLPAPCNMDISTMICGL